MQKICVFPVTCPNTKVRVGRSAFFLLFLFCFLLKKLFKNVKTVFSDDFCKEKKMLGSGPFFKDGRVTGNTHVLFCSPNV